MILLDAKVVSEFMRPQPDPNVLTWFDAHESLPLFLSAVAEDFAGRILPFDSAAALAYGKISARRKSMGSPISMADAGIAAIAQVQRFRLATRNTADFECCGVEVENPWG